MYKVYIIRSLKNGRFYIGHTEDVDSRLIRHNSGFVKSTKAYLPWELIYVETFDTKSEAYMREMEVKGYKGGFKFKKLIS